MFIHSDSASSSPTGRRLECVAPVMAKVNGRVEPQTVRIESGLAKRRDPINKPKTNRHKKPTCRPSAQELNDFFDNGAIGLHWAGPDGIIRRANRAELKLLGYSPDEYIGHHIVEFHADRQVGQDMLERLENGETLHDFEARLRCKDRSIKYVLMDANVLWENGKFIHTRCFTRDITDRKMAEQNLKILNENLEERIIQRSRNIRLLQEVAVAANEAGTIEQAFQFTIARIRAHQHWPIGRAYLLAKDAAIQNSADSIWDMAGSRRWERLREATDAVAIDPNSTLIGRVANDGRAVFIKDIALEPDFPIAQAALTAGLTSAFAFPTLVGKEVVAVLEFYADETIEIDNTLLDVMASIGTQLGRVVERKRLQESERLAAMGATAAVFAHEIGNPLNGISTTLQLLQRHVNKRKDSVAIATLAELQKETRRLDSLLQEFRSLSRATKLNRGKIDLREITREVLNTGIAMQDPGKICVTEEFDADLPPVMADGEKLKQVLLNLFKNAIEAMPDGGVLKARAVNHHRHVMLEISDTGIGIPDDIDIFQLFTTTKPSGTGLGLAIVRQIVEAHGGSITYSRQPAKGTTFRLTLPLAETGSFDRDLGSIQSAP